MQNIVSPPLNWLRVHSACSNNTKIKHATYYDREIQYYICFYEICNCPLDIKWSPSTWMIIGLWVDPCFITTRLHTKTDIQVLNPCVKESFYALPVEKWMEPTSLKIIYESVHVHVNVHVIALRIAPSICYISWEDNVVFASVSQSEHIYNTNQLILLFRL